MAWILVWLFVAMSWSGFVALVHDHRASQSRLTPKVPLHVVRAERSPLDLEGLEEHRADYRSDEASAAQLSKSRSGAIGALLGVRTTMR